MDGAICFIIAVTCGVLSGVLHDKIGGLGSAVLVGIAFLFLVKANIDWNHDEVRALEKRVRQLESKESLREFQEELRKE